MMLQEGGSLDTRGRGDSKVCRARTGEHGCFASRRKIEGVLRLLRGEGPGRLSQELQVGGATLGIWREKVPAGVMAALMSRLEDNGDELIIRLRTKDDEIVMEIKLRKERTRRAGVWLPLARRTLRRRLSPPHSPQESPTASPAYAEIGSRSECQTTRILVANALTERGGGLPR